MFNPTVLFAVAVSVFLACVGLFGSGLFIGIKWEKAEALTDTVIAQHKAIVDANSAVVLAIERTKKATEKEALARLAARTSRMKGELDAAQKSRPECVRDGVSMQLLNDSIRDANGEGNSPAKLPDQVRPITGATGWFGKFSEKLGIFDSGNVRRLPPTPP